MTSNITRCALLYIDDDPNDRLLVQEAISTISVPFDFYGVDSLDAAMDHFSFLAQVNRPSSRPRPAIVLLDYDLGRQHGTDFLYWLRTQHRNTAVPVVMYSGSTGYDCVRECYSNGANHFLRKAKSFDRTKAILRGLHTCFYYRPVNFQFLARLPRIRTRSSDTRGACGLIWHVANCTNKKHGRILQVHNILIGSMMIDGRPAAHL